MPIFKKKVQRSSSTTELLIALSILLAVGLFVLYIKIDLDSGTQQSYMAIISQQVDQLQQRVLKTESAAKPAPVGVASPSAGPTAVTQSVTVMAPAIDTSAWQDYSSTDYSLKYPTSFKIEPATASFKALVVRGAMARVEVFKMKDFGGDRPIGFEPESGTVTQQALDSYVPKVSVSVTGPKGTFDVWMYYPSNNAAAKAQAEAIYQSIKVK